MQAEFEVADLEGAYRYAAHHGVLITPEDRSAIARIQEAELNRLMTLERGNVRSGSSAWVDKFNRAYPAFLKALIGMGEIMLTFSQTLIIAFGIPGVLVLLLIVEQQRVLHGISLFEPDANLSNLSASAVVALNIILEFLIHYSERNNVTEVEYRASFRLWLNQSLYVLGASKNWKPQPRIVAARWRFLLGLVTWGILALALAGSMRAIIDTAQGSWYAALGNILTQSSLSQALTWIGGLLFATIAVFGAQGLSRYVANKCAEIIKIMESKATNKPELISQALGFAGAQYVMAKVKATQRDRRNNVSAVNGFAEPVPLYRPVVQGQVQAVYEPVPQGPSKHSLAVEFLKANPDLVNKTVRELEELSGINKNYFGAAKKEVVPSVRPVVQDTVQGDSE